MVPAWILCFGFVLGLAGLQTSLHYAAHGVVNAHQVALALFLASNVMVSFWELGLHRHADAIHEEWEAIRLDFKGREMDRVARVFLTPIPLG